MDALVGAYLEWQLNPLRAHVLPPDSLQDHTIYPVKVVDMFCKSFFFVCSLFTNGSWGLACDMHYLAIPSPTIHINAVLVCHGCIGSAPITPSVCITFHILENFCQTHRVMPCMSVQAEACKLCAMHNVSHDTYMAIH